MKKLRTIAPFAIILAAILSYGQTSPATRQLSVFVSDSKIANVPQFFEANKAALNLAVSNRPNLSVNGNGPVSNIVDTASLAWVVSNGVARATASGSSGSPWSSLIVCQEDSSVHAIGVYKMGTNYLLSLVAATNAPLSGVPSSIPVAAGDLSVHQIYVAKLGTNYLIGLTQ